MSGLNVPTDRVDHLADNERNLIRAFRLLDSHTQNAVFRFALLEAGAEDAGDIDCMELDRVATPKEGPTS